MMPPVRAQKKKRHTCDYGECGKAFTRPYDLDRHKQIHCKYEDRKYGCTFVGCNFRANQQAGVDCHFDAIHKKKKIPCDYPGCRGTFSDPSSHCKHRQNIHGISAESSSPTGSEMAGTRKKKKQPAPNPIAVHARVARHVEEHSQQDAKNILGRFAAFALESSGSSSATTSPRSYPPSDGESYSRTSSPSTGSSVSSSATHRSRSFYKRPASK